jgi:uncharacterized protein YbaR (Trm112 family)
MTFDNNLLDIICCPVTRQPMSKLASTTLAKLNELVREQKISSRDETLVSEELEGALVTDDGKLAYPIVDGIPVLLAERGISLAQLNAN